jgi:hypothetical protein
MPSRSKLQKSEGSSPIGGLRVPPLSTNFDQQRLTALFGSDAQPVYGTRDPTTGRVTLDWVTDSPSPISGGRPASPNRLASATKTVATSSTLEEASETNNETPVDRKDTRVPETNEINPFELLPPQFHDLLNIPIHDYGNGTTYNPYDKYKVSKLPKIPMVSSGYANTKVQGSSGPTSSPPPPPLAPFKDPYDAPSDSGYGLKSTKSTRRPSQKSKATTAPPYYDYEDEVTTEKNRPTTTTSRPAPSTISKNHGKQPQTNRKPEPAQSEVDLPTRHQEAAQRPQYNEPSRNRPEYMEPPRYKPEYQDPPRYKPESHQPPRHKPEPPARQPEPPRYEVYLQSSEPIAEEPPTYIAQSYKPPNEVTEIKVTPKPFFAVNNDGTGSVQSVNVGTVEDVPDIIYDYDDERGKGDGVLFMFDTNSNFNHDFTAQTQSHPQPQPQLQPHPQRTTPATFIPTKPPRAASEVYQVPKFRPSPTDRKSVV